MIKLNPASDSYFARELNPPSSQIWGIGAHQNISPKLFSNEGVTCGTALFRRLRRDRFPLVWTDSSEGRMDRQPLVNPRGSEKPSIIGSVGQQAR